MRNPLHPSGIFISRGGSLDSYVDVRLVSRDSPGA
mgnify:CR=1 FL=1